MNNLHIYKLTKNSLKDIKDIKDTKDINDLIFLSPYENNPLLSLGYHYYIGRTRSSLQTYINNLNIKKEDESKNEFYYVVNNYEINISNYTEPLFEVTNRDFYKLWEIYYLFDILDNNSLEIVCINDKSNSIKIFREKYFNKKDKISTEYKKGANLIISNQFANTENEFIEILINEIKNIIESQEKNGNLILRIFDTFTYSTLKLLYILTSLYETSYIYKPLYSRPSENEKYIICKNFISKDTRKIISSLTEILSTIKKNKDLYISNIYLNLELPDDYLNLIKYINVKLVNEQQILINEIIKYIKENNYFGDKYHEYRNLQIESNKFWTKTFFSLIKTDLKPDLKLILEKNNSDKDKFVSILI